MSAQHAPAPVERAHPNLKPSALAYGVRRAFVAVVLWRGGK
jgi:hypothetical protein